MRLDVKVGMHLREGWSLKMDATNTRVHVQRQLLARSERVKGIDFHPTEPWVRLIKAHRNRSLLSVDSNNTV